MKKLRELKESRQQILVNVDGDNVYTKVLVNENIEVALDVLFKRLTPPPIPFNRSQLGELLKLSICVPFRFLDKFYIQCEGVAMGPSLGLILDDLFMSTLQTKLNKFSTNKPLL